MKTDKQYFLLLTVFLSLGLAVLLAGCRTADARHDEAAKPGAGKTTALSGAQLWANNCARCHNYRSPSSYSDAEWDVALHHMRIRANLTAEEHRQIVKFLKSAN